MNSIIKYSRLLLIVSIPVLLQSCDSVYNFICYGSSEKDFALFDLVREGDLDALKAYLENGRDPKSKSFDFRGLGFGSWRELYWKVVASSSEETFLAQFQSKK